MRIRTFFLTGIFFILLTHKKKFYFLFLHLQAFFISQTFNFFNLGTPAEIFFWQKKFLKAKRLYMGIIFKTFILPTYHLFFMGERVGFNIKQGNETSLIYRQQWMEDPKIVVSKTWDTLLTRQKYVDGKFQTVKGEVDQGDVALRGDLDIGRAFAALVYSNYEPPFESIEKDIHCDINDHGLVTIDISDYKNWVITQTEIDYDYESGSSEGETKIIGYMTEKGYKEIVGYDDL